MSRIPESFIADLLDRLDIVEVIGQRLQMKRAGREFHALCPFHDEKTPSFTISPQKQFYHCFGCGAHGTAIGFLMQYDGLEFVDAVEDLARSIGLKVPKTGFDKPRVDSDLYTIVTEADQYFRRQLRKSPKAIDYLKQRGVSGEIAREFGLGYAPDQWNQLSDALQAKGYSIAQQDQAGLLAGQEGGRRYDRFRDRVMFPIADRRGRTIAFGGRSFGDDDGPKYLNSPETSLFHKGRNLYGLSQAMPVCRDSGEILVVEGYMDVIALAQVGIRDVVATLGTATTSDHAEMLFRIAPHVICCFDGDNAGRRAAWRAAENLLPRLREGRQASFLFLPNGEDPDSLVKGKGAGAFTALRQAAMPLSDYFFDHFSAEVDLHSLDGRSRLVALARPALERIPEGSFRDLMFERLQRIAHLNKSLDQAHAGGPSIRQAPAAQVRRTLIRSAVSMLLAQPDLASRVTDIEQIRALSLPGSDLLAKMVEFLRARPNLNTGSVIELWPDAEQAHFMGVLAGSMLLDDGTDLVTEFDDAIEALRRAYIKQRITQLQEQQTRTGLDTEEKNELRNCLNELAGTSL